MSDKGLEYLEKQLAAKKKDRAVLVAKLEGTKRERARLEREASTSLEGVSAGELKRAAQDQAQREIEARSLALIEKELERRIDAAAAAIKEDEEAIADHHFQVAQKRIDALEAEAARKLADFLEIAKQVKEIGAGVARPNVPPSQVRPAVGFNAAAVRHVQAALTNYGRVYAGRFGKHPDVPIFVNSTEGMIEAPADFFVNKPQA